MMHLIFAALLVPDLAVPALHKHRHTHVQHVALLERSRNWNAGNHAHWSVIQAEIIRAKKQNGAK